MAKLTVYWLDQDQTQVMDQNGDAIEFLSDDYTSLISASGSNSNMSNSISALLYGKVDINSVSYNTNAISKIASSILISESKSNMLNNLREIVNPFSSISVTISREYLKFSTVQMSSSSNASFVATVI